MTPISTALPPPAVEVTETWYYPYTGTSGVGVGVTVMGDKAVQRSATNPNSIQFGPYGSSGGSFSTNTIRGTNPASVDNPPARYETCRLQTNAASLGGAMRPPFQHGCYGPAASFAPGAKQEPASVVNVYNFAFACSDTVDNWPDDTTGIVFVTDGNVITDALRPGSLPTNGFGLFWNSNGAGGSRVEYLSWLGAATVERVALAPVVPDMSLWNSARFIIVTALSGQAAEVTIEVNGVTFLTRNFSNAGSPDIPEPSATRADAMHYVCGTTATAGGFASWFVRAWGYDGRFTPGGEEIQPFGA